MQTVVDIVLKAVRFIPIAIAVASCVPAKYAEVYAILKCEKDNLQMAQSAIKSKDFAAINKQLADCPPKPKGMRQDETLVDYIDRLKDEWQEGDCGYQAGFRARSIAESEYIRSQCLRDLELRRIRKELEKANKK